MAHRFNEYLSDFIDTDPICRTVPKHSNKKNIRQLLKESADRFEFIEKYSDTKRLSTLVPLLNERMNVLKSLAERFESLYNEYAENNAKLISKQQQLSKQEKALENVEKLKQNLIDESTANKDRLTKLESEQNAEMVKYAETRQAELEAEFNKQQTADHERQVIVNQNKILKEKIESVMKDIKTQTDLMDKDYEDKRTEVNNSKVKNLKNFDSFKKELDKRDELVKEGAEANEFCDRVNDSLEAVEKSVSEYEQLFNNSIKDFEKPLKKVEKIKKENIAMRKASEEAMARLTQNNVGIMQLVDENVALRNRIEKEEKQQAILSKLLEDIEKKLRESG